MNEPLTPPSHPPADLNADALLLQLRRKEGSWVEWGQACQELQKAGYSPQAIFEDTGFEPIQQNQVMVAAQVYAGLVQAQTDPSVLEFFGQRGSDILYELRVFPQTERGAIATFMLSHKLDADEAHDIARALKDFSRVRQPPAAFTSHPGDGVAHQCWMQARQKSDLQERSRLIAKGLRYAHSDTARRELEKLLTDFSVLKTRVAPRLPVSRLDSEVELPRILPLAGKLPLPTPTLTTVPVLQEKGAFRMVQSSVDRTWVSLPGWQVILNAEDPVVVMGESDRLPMPLEQDNETVLIVLDRADGTWTDQSYFAVDIAGVVEIQWFPEAPREALLGRVLLVVRPPHILDEGATKDLWALEE